MAQLTQAQLDALLADNTSNDITAADMRNVAQSLYNPHGWAEYQDTQYTSGAPLAVTANTDTALPNNAATAREAYLPPDVSAGVWYDGTTINFDEGDAFILTFEAKALTSSASGAYVELWLDIGGAVGEIYRGIWATFPKGNNVEAGMLRSFGAFALDTWAANGATAYLRSNVAVNVYEIRYVIQRTSKANI